MIDYRDCIDQLSPGHLGGFFEGWPNAPTPETHLRILEGSSVVVFAVDTELDRVVGFVTAISDGVLSAYVPLLEVLGSHRGQGIGSELVRRLCSRLSALYMIDVVCDPSLAAFYERFGMTELSGMALRNAHYQSGGTL